MKKKLHTREVSDPGEIKRSFDQQARSYAEQHGKADQLLSYRLGLFESIGDFKPVHKVLDIGCGNGHHLRGLCHLFQEGIGIDFSQGMVEVAKATSQGLNLSFHQDDATKLKTISDSSIDRVICSGALEHMIHQQEVLHQVFRVLKTNGAFIALTLNGEYWWYKKLAPSLKLETKHYSTDQFLSADQWMRKAHKAGFDVVEVSPWTFIPKGDMPYWTGQLLAGMDYLGRLTNRPNFRGGLRLNFRKK